MNKFHITGEATNIGEVHVIVDDAHVLGICLSHSRVERLCAHIEKYVGKAEFVPGANLLTQETLRQFNEYLSGRRKIFDLPIKITGTDYTLKILAEISQIPYGQLRSYMDVAMAVGNMACRAAGSAVGRNPLPVIIPCHRVIRSDGGIGGYGGIAGLPVKKQLLAIEGIFYK